MQRQTVQNIGWYGVIAILSAYALLSFKILSVEGAWYQLLNLTGAVAVVIEAASKKDRQPVVLNIVWAAVAAITLVQLWI